MLYLCPSKIHLTKIKVVTQNRNFRAEKEKLVS